MVAGVEGTEHEVLSRATELSGKIQVVTTCCVLLMVLREKAFDAICGDMSSQPYDLRFSSVSSGEVFFQCVYLLMDQADAESQRAAAIARRVLGKNENDTYMPHLSLLYSDMPTQDR